MSENSIEFSLSNSEQRGSWLNSGYRTLDADIHHALDNRDVVLRAKGGRLERISQNSPSYAALHYVLLFPKGENGWHPRIPIRGAQLREQGENARQRDGEERAYSQVVSDTCYYAYRLHVRDGSQPPLFYGRKLFQQFVVDV